MDARHTVWRDVSFMHESTSTGEGVYELCRLQGYNV